MEKLGEVVTHVVPEGAVGLVLAQPSLCASPTFLD